MNMNEFLDIFENPSESDIIESDAYLLMGEYLFLIEKKMEEISMSKKELAEKIGTSASYLSKFFNLNQLINFKTLAKIQKALDVRFELKDLYIKNNEINNIDYSSFNNKKINKEFLQHNDLLVA
jgi:transcriptional regulator with XRE-family HTH domain